MSIKRAVFNGSAALSAGLGLVHVPRAYATVTLAGQAVAVGQQYYEQPSLFVGPPESVTTIATTTNTAGTCNLLGCGTWTDGTPATIQHFCLTGATTSGRYVAIRVNDDLTVANAWGTFTGLPTAKQRLVTDIGKGDGNGPDLLAGTPAGTFGENSAVYRHQPKNGMVTNGLAIVTGQVTRAATSWGYMGGMFLDYWDNTSGFWKNAYTGPAYNTENLGCGNDWVRPHLCYLDPEATALEAFGCQADYMSTGFNNTGSDKCAGSVLFWRQYRATPTSPWQIDQVVELVRPIWDVAALGTNVGVHIHDVLAVPYTEGGVDGIMLIVIVAHQGTQTTHYYFRANRNYTEGVTQTGATQFRSTPTGGVLTPIDPSTITIPISNTDGATQHGWTTCIHAMGDNTLNTALNNQPMSLSRMRGSNDFLATCDETCRPVFRGVLPTAASLATPIVYKATNCDRSPSFFGISSCRPAFTTWGISAKAQDDLNDLMVACQGSNVDGLGGIPNLENGTAKSIGTLARVGTLVTATSTAHGAVSGDSVQVAGAIPANFNGHWQVTRVDADHYTYSTPANNSPKTASGTITGIKRPAWSARRQAQRFLYSSDSGLNWGACYAPGTLLPFTPLTPARSYCMGWHGDTMVFAVTNGTTNIQLRAMPKPYSRVSRPLGVTTPSVNYAAGTVTWGGVGSGSTHEHITDLSTVSTGRVIPPCPCNSSIIRLRSTPSGNATINGQIRLDGSGVDGTSFHAGDETTPITHKMKLRIWVLRVPVADAAYASTTAPYNTANGPTIRIDVACTNYAKIASTESAGGRLDDSGWVAYDFDLDPTSVLDFPPSNPASPTNPNATYQSYVRVSTGSSAAYGDFLISGEVIAGATCDWPAIAPPAAGVKAPVTTVKDIIKLSGYNCGLASDGDWAAVMHFQLSPRAWDAYTRDDRRPTSRYLGIWRQSATKYITIGYDTVNSRFVFVFVDGGTTDTRYLTADAPYQFEPMRGDSMTIGLSCTQGGLGEITIAAAVGGTEIATATASGHTDVRPVEFELANGTDNNESILAHAVWADEDTAYSAANLKAKMADGTTVAPPGTVSRRTLIVAD